VEVTDEEGLGSALRRKLLIKFGTAKLSQFFSPLFDTLNLLAVVGEKARRFAYA